MSGAGVQLLFCVQLFATPWTAPCQASLAITNSRSLLKLMSVESVMLSNHLALCRPLLLLPSIFPSLRGFSKGSALHIRWPKYWNFSISPSNEYSGLISFKIDWSDLLAVKGRSSVFSSTQFKKHHFLCSAFFTVQLLQLYITTGKTIVLTIQTFVGRVMSLLFNCLL